MAWFKKENKKPRQPRRERLEIPADVWEKCEACGHTDIREKFERNMNVCPNCDYHRRIRANDYCTLLLDDGTMEEVEVDLRSTDPLGFPDYPARLKRAIDKAGDTDALLACSGLLDSLPVNLGVMDFAFMGGSMGSVVGEKIARLGQRSLERKYPLIVVSASGGARMQEGVLSLMQMAKVAAILAQLAERRIPYISILTNPTTGGVSASYAMLGDANLAEPGAVIGFAGPRVIKQTLGQDLPEGFQTSEFLLDHGMLDQVVHRRNLKRTVSQFYETHVRATSGYWVDVALTLSLAGYKDALDYLFARTTGGFKFGLERTFALLEHLGGPQHAYPSLHIAGTNGKGSSVATMAALLTATGKRVATYTSPHLVDFRERMIVGGEPIPADDVIDFVTRHTPFVEEIGASFFEATTAMAFDYFARAKADVAVIEAGLGGRLDSTNVLMPVVAGVTSIGLDHTEYLGSTLEEIAREKAGIFKSGRAAVIGERDPRIRELLAAHARAAGASSVRIVADEMQLERIRVDDAGTSCEIEWKGVRTALRTPLAGRHQAANLAFSLVTLDAAGGGFAVSPEQAQHDLERVRIPGRFQHVGQFIFDVAHNPAGIEVLVQTIDAVSPPRPIAVVLCVLRDKDWREMIRLLGSVASRFVLTMAPTAPASRAWDLAEAASFARELGFVADVVDDFAAALSHASENAPTVLVTGSFHTVGDAMSLLQVSPLNG